MTDMTYLWTMLGAAGLSPLFPAMGPFTKTWLGVGLVIVALFEYWSAMRVFGTKTAQPGTKLVLRLHRIFGYVFLVYMLYLMWVGLNMYERLSQAGGYHLTPRTFFHTFLAMSAFVILLIKISFIRFYRKYRPYVNMLGVVLVGTTVVLWGVAGLLFIYMMRGVKAG